MFQLLCCLPKICKLLENECPAIRHMSARCIAAISLLNTEHVMEIIIKTIVPLLSVADSDIKREGAAEAIFCAVNKLQLAIIPYVVLLVIPLLGI